MDNFSFLKSLNDVESKKANNIRPKLTEGIKYEEYEVLLFGGKTTTVFIPHRNSDIFESQLEDTNILTEAAVRIIMRKCNGVTEI